MTTAKKVPVSGPIGIVPADSGDISFVRECDEKNPLGPKVGAFDMSGRRIVMLADDRVGYVMTSRIGRNYRIEKIKIHPDYRCRGLHVDVLNVLIKMATDLGLDVRVNAASHEASREMLADAGFACEGSDGSIFVKKRVDDMNQSRSMLR